MSLRNEFFRTEIRRKLVEGNYKYCVDTKSSVVALCLYTNKSLGLEAAAREIKVDQRPGILPDDRPAATHQAALRMI